MMPVDAVTQMITKFRHEDRSLPSFRGSVLDWPLFIRKFRKTTEEFNISDDANHKRLDKAIRGGARDVVRDLLRNPCFVNEVIEVLEATYGGEDNISAAIMKQLVEMKPLQSSLHNLVPFSYEVAKVRRMIQQSGSDCVKQEAMRKLSLLIPRQQQQAWDIQLQVMGKTDKPSIDDFANWLAHLKTICKVYTTGGDNNNKTERNRASESRLHFRNAWPQRRRPNRTNHPYEAQPTQRDAPAGDRRTARYNRFYGDNTPNAEGDGRYAIRGAPNGPWRPTRDTNVPMIANQRRLQNGHGEDHCEQGCGDQHRLEDCPKFKNGTQPERFRIIRSLRRCPCCCGKHSISICPTRQQ